jgi:hypothetical protein
MTPPIKGQVDLGATIDENTPAGKRCFISKWI